MGMAMGTAEEWAKQEFGATDLGDARRTERLVEVGAALADAASYIL